MSVAFTDGPRGNLSDSLGGESRQVTGVLLAVLCNPPTGPRMGSTSVANLGVLRDMLGYHEVQIANLVPVATRSTSDLAGEWDSITRTDVARRIEAAARLADGVVVGWGVGQPAGWPRARWTDLTNAATSAIHVAGHEFMLHVGAHPRHPSRWRQFTGPTHKRFSGPDFGSRLLQALEQTQLGPATTPLVPISGARHHP
ncbi:DUF1643 domain-containing protein [Phycicoccus sp. Soil803]|uniref:DUF1643 domain-containing protein n=1 Tax=Phycicoccus sp. Soil803 TaxID=1736415 RepID=UPI0012FBD724